ncbi:MAG: acyltransferase, partial [Verrucomicrobiota bacterium]
LRNGAAVSVGHHTLISDDWTLADLSPEAGSGGGPKIRIGSHCSIMHSFQCNASESVEIQDHVLMAPRVFITDSDHVVDPNGERTTASEKLISAPVVIGHDCWIGVNAVILKGVRIGHHSVIGANAVVTKDVPPFSTAVGVPAKVVRKAESTANDLR